MKLLKRTILTMLILLVLTAPVLSLAESDYEEGNGWIYQDGTLTITENGGLKDFVFNEQDPITEKWTHEHSVIDVSTLRIGKNVTSLSIEVYDCNVLSPSSVTIEPGNACFIIDNGWVVNKETITLFGATNLANRESVEAIENIPEYIEHIGARAFSDYGSLKHITIPKNVISIGDFAFDSCASLQFVSLPSGLQSIGARAFDGCNQLKRISLGENISFIGQGAFSSCTGVESIDIHSTKLNTISSDLFGACYKLIVLELPEHASRIETLAYRICYELKTLVINSSELVVDENAFYSCDNLRRLVFTKGIPQFFDETLFGETGKTPDGNSYISDSSNRRGEIIPYPTLYYTAAYADEWAPNGETEWNGYAIQQISQEELDAVLAEARGEALPAAVSSPAPATVQQVETPAPEKTSVEVAPATGAEVILLAAIGTAVVAATALLVIHLRKTKPSEKR